MPLSTACGVGLGLAVRQRPNQHLRNGAQGVNERRLRARVQVVASTLVSASARNVQSAPGVSPAGAWLRSGGTASLSVGPASSRRDWELRAKASAPEGYESASGSDSDAEEPEARFGLLPAELLKEYGCAPLCSVSARKVNVLAWFRPVLLRGSRQSSSYVYEV